MCRTVHNLLTSLICIVQLFVRIIMVIALMVENLIRMFLQSIYNFLSFLFQLISLIPICFVFLLTSKMKCFVCGGGGGCAANRGGGCDCFMTLAAASLLFFIFRATGVLDKIFYKLGYAKAEAARTAGTVTECSRNETEYQWYDYDNEGEAETKADVAKTVVLRYDTNGEQILEGDITELTTPEQIADDAITTVTIPNTLTITIAQSVKENPLTTTTVGAVTETIPPTIILSTVTHNDKVPKETTTNALRDKDKTHVEYLEVQSKSEEKINKIFTTKSWIAVSPKFTAKTWSTISPKSSETEWTTVLYYLVA